MTPLNNTYIKDLDDETMNLLHCTNDEASTNMQELFLAPQALTPDGSEFFPLVHAYKSKWHDERDVIRFRVLTNDVGITISVPCSKGDLLYRRYRSILERLQNTRVEISFPEIEVHHSKHGLYFISHDFKIKPPVNLSQKATGFEIPEVEITLPQPQIMI